MGRMRGKFVLAVASAWAMGLVVWAQGDVKAVKIPLPPMGWSSWNAFSNTVDSDVVLGQARALKETGMAQAGYQYVNIDEGWWLGKRDAEGNIVVEEKAWPALAAGERAGDMGNVVRAIHAMGLKAGIYTDAGRDGCSFYGPDLGPKYAGTGSEGHYEQDFLQFAKWGFDYVKVDWCGGNGENLDPAVQYAEVARAIEHAAAVTGRRLNYSICDWGKDSPATWAPGIGGVPAVVWRTGGDIVDPIVAGTKNAGRRAQAKDLFREFDAAVHAEAQHTGFYNDPDMMVVGMPGLSEDENRLHMAMWALLGGPLLAGADLKSLSAEARATLTNAAVIAVDQDGLGLQGVKVAERGPGLEVWAKRLAKEGTRAVLLLNRTAAPAEIGFNAADLGLVGELAGVTDVWTGKTLGRVEGGFAATVAPEDGVMVVAAGQEAKLTLYAAARALHAEKPLVFPGVVARTHATPVEVVYLNPGKSTRFAELRVNGRTGIRVAFPPTGSAKGAVWIETELDRAAGKNELEFSAVGGVWPVIEEIGVQ